MEALARLAAAGNLPGPDQARMGGTLENLVRRALSLEGVAPSGPDETMPFLDRLLSIVHKSLSDPALRWTLDQPGQCEVGIEGIVNGEYVLARVDRTFVATATATRYIVDYKVVSHEGGGLERFLLERARGYSGQLEGYAKLAGALGKASKSVRLALYFAAQGIWAVWTPGGEMNLLPPGVREL
jgi:hypothetical protein